MEVVAKWEPAPDPEGDDVYTLELWGKTNLLHTIVSDYHKVRFSIEIRRIRARVKACDPDTCSDWSPWSEWYPPLPDDPVEIDNPPGDDRD